MFLDFSRSLLFIATAAFVTASGAASAQGTSKPASRRVTIEPYKGPPILLDEKRVTVPPNIVDRQVITDKYPDNKLRIERQVAKYSDNHVESDGFYREFHPNGQKFIEGQYREGRQDGEWSYFFDNGQLNRKMSFQRGRLHGQWENYRADGTLAAKRSYENGLRHGVWVTYDDTGKQPLTEENYKAGKPDGLAKAWFPDGKPRLELTWKEGVRHGPGKQWNDKGQLTTELNYVDGKLDGTVKILREDGTTTTQQYKNGLLVSEKTG
jgi:antitoxin component YwqK of YwqJK toxin-antitoxin module